VGVPRLRRAEPLRIHAPKYLEGRITLKTKRPWLLLLAGASALLLGCATGSKEATAPAGVQSTLSRAVDRYGVCGAVVATIRNRQLDAVETSGASCEFVAPPHAGSVFQAASLSKPVFAYAVLKLVEQGRMALDAPVVSYLPGGYQRRFDPFALPSASKTELVDDRRLAAVTVRMALNHSSGLPNWSRGPIKFTAEPGKAWHYSGEAYVLLQRAVEAVTGSSLDRYAVEHVFQPLGMAHSSFVWEDRFEAALLPGTSSGTPLPARPLKVPVAAATLYTTAPDFGRFLAAVLGDERLLALITESSVAVDPRLQLSWGNGWGIAHVGARSYLWQWGNNPGYRAFAMADPDSGDGFVLLTNSDRGLALSEPLAHAVLPAVHRVFKLDMLRY
jgi:CubicO group peptidase (beta-lactamase class C family)